MHSRKNLIFCVAAFLLSCSTFAQGQADTYKQQAIEWVEANKATLNKASMVIWNFAETGLAEHKSAEYLADMLERDGFAVQRSIADMPTAFVATYGSGEPVIGILAEYDALPGLSQKAATTHKEPLVRAGSGHGCGHSLFGVGSAGGAMAIKSVMKKHKLAGTIKLFGCPAEETLVGKVYMAKAGIFDDLDICLDWHPGNTNAVSLGSSKAMNNFEVTFYGKTAHGSADPWNGRSALDAVELMNIGVNFLREHMEPTARIHYVIPNAGMAPNVVPDYARVWYFVREKDRESVDELYDRVLKIAAGAATMTETTHKLYLITGVYNKLVNHVVAELLYKNFELVGVPQFTEEEQEFARQLQRSFGKEEKGLTTEIEEFVEPNEPTRGGSTDVAEVSWLTPTASFRIACWPLETPAHSWGVVTCSGSSIGLKGMAVAAKTFAAAGIEALTDASIIEKAQAEFRKKTKDFTYKSAVPNDQKPRLPEGNK
ncbi:MAG: amidohydrolase [Planctomycetota bacterium]|jgi:aminobenzoyl-glutamate utilization protein B